MVKGIIFIQHVLKWNAMHPGKMSEIMTEFQFTDFNCPFGQWEHFELLIAQDNFLLPQAIRQGTCHHSIVYHQFICQDLSQEVTNHCAALNHIPSTLCFPGCCRWLLIWCGLTPLVKGMWWGCVAREKVGWHSALINCHFLNLIYNHVPCSSRICVWV